MARRARSQGRRRMRGARAKAANPGTPGAAHPLRSAGDAGAGSRPRPRPCPRAAPRLRQRRDERLELRDHPRPRRAGIACPPTPHPPPAPTHPLVRPRPLIGRLPSKPRLLASAARCVRVPEGRGFAPRRGGARIRSAARRGRGGGRGQTDLSEPAWAAAACRWEPPPRSRLLKNVGSVLSMRAGKEAGGRGGERRAMVVTAARALVNEEILKAWTQFE